MISVGFGQKGRMCPFKHDCASSHCPSGLFPRTEKTQDKVSPLYHPNMENILAVLAEVAPLSSSTVHIY